MKTLVRHPSRIAFALAVAFCLLSTGRELKNSLPYFDRAQRLDFGVYYVAAQLVATGQSQHIYDGAATGADPQTRYAAPDTGFARQAQSDGLARIQLFVYPPLLADGLAPLTWLPLPMAIHAWQAINALALLLTALLITSMLGYRWRSGAGALVLLGLLAMRPVWICLQFGQVTILLLLLLTTAVFLYGRQQRRLAGCVLAVAVLLKLTPLALLLPLLLWRDWRSVRWLVAGTCFLLVAIAVVNGPGTLGLFFFHVMPAMAGGMPALDNKSVPSAVQALWHQGAALRGAAAPRAVLLLGKLVSVAIFVCAAWLTWRRGSNPTARDRVLMLAAYSLLSVCLAPVSWQHAYAAAFLMLACAWQRALTENRGPGYSLLLAAATIAAGSISFTALAVALGPPYLLAYLAPLLSIALCLVDLARRPPSRSADLLQVPRRAALAVSTSA